MFIGLPVTETHGGNLGTGAHSGLYSGQRLFSKRPFYGSLKPDAFFGGAVFYNLSYPMSLLARKWHRTAHFTRGSVVPRGLFIYTIIPTHFTSPLKMEAAFTSETSATLSTSTRCSDPKVGISC
jgi:hypothetical protein